MTLTGWFWRLLLAALPLATWVLVKMPGWPTNSGPLRAPNDCFEVRPGAISVGTLIPEATIAAVLTQQGNARDLTIADVEHLVSAREIATEQGFAWVRWSGGRFVMLESWLLAFLLSPLAFPLARAVFRDHARARFGQPPGDPAAPKRNALARLARRAASLPLGVITALAGLRRRPLALVAGLLGVPLAWLAFHGLETRCLRPLCRIPATNLRVFACGGYLVISPPERYWRSTPNEALCRHDAWPPKRRVCYYRFDTHWRDRAEIDRLEQALAAPPSVAPLALAVAAYRGAPAPIPQIQTTWGTAWTPWRGTSAALISSWYVAAPALLLCAVFLRAYRQLWFRGSRLRANCCPMCAYPLHGLPEPRCPECGTRVVRLRQS